jgi:hypothetical protein
MWANGMQTTTLKAFDYAAGSFSASPTAWGVRFVTSCLRRAKQLACAMQSSSPEMQNLTRPTTSDLATSSLCLLAVLSPHMLHMLAASLSEHVLVAACRIC